MSKHLSMDVRVPIEEGNPAIRRIESLCIKCGQCRDVCQKQISVGHHYDLLKTGDTAICIHCGQWPMSALPVPSQKFRTGCRYSL